MMNQRVIEINRKRLILTERPATDVQDVFDYYERFEDKGTERYKFTVRIAVWVTYQALRSTRKNIPLWLFWKKVRYVKYSIKYLAQKVAPHVLFECQRIVIELDELDKKKVETEEKKFPDSNVNS